MTADIMIADNSSVVVADLEQAGHVDDLEKALIKIKELEKEIQDKHKPPTWSEFLRYLAGFFIVGVLLFTLLALDRLYNVYILNALTFSILRLGLLACNWIAPGELVKFAKSYTNWFFLLALVGIDIGTIRLMEFIMSKETNSGTNVISKKKIY